MAYSNTGTGTQSYNVSWGGIATTGLKYPTAATATTAARAWTNPQNVYASDDVRATLTSGGTAALNHAYLNASGFGLNIPDGATIVSISVGVEMLRSGGTIGDIRLNTVQLMKNYARVGSNLGNTNNVGTVEAVTKFNGGLWGATWTAEELNSPSFGVSIRPVGTTSANRTLNVDAITVEVEYVEPSVTAVNTGWLSPTAIFGDGWTNPSNIYASDNVRATQTIAAGAEGGGLFADNFDGLTIPTGATIKGIEAKFEGAVTAGSLYYAYVFVTDNGDFTTRSAQSRNLVEFTGTEGSFVLGGPNDLWGGVDTNNDNIAERAWLPSDFSANRSIFVAFGAGASGATVSIDQISLRVTYEPAVENPTFSYSNTSTGAQSYVPVYRTASEYSNLGVGTQSYAIAFKTKTRYSNSGVGTQSYSIKLESIQPPVVVFDHSGYPSTRSIHAPIDKINERKAKKKAKRDAKKAEKLVPKRIVDPKSLEDLKGAIKIDAVVNPRIEEAIRAARLMMEQERLARIEEEELQMVIVMALAHRRRNRFHRFAA